MIMESTVEVLQQQIGHLRFKLYQAEQQAAAPTPAQGSVIVSKELTKRLLVLMHPDTQADASHHEAERNDLTHELILIRKQGAK
jgi:hypothetical protein